ncbi:hypothetical protein CORMATOL_01260 [Corynebacterium matruchotii ATCC 33806]|uniref:Uncharacterized protein n=1 Tax=Corynebacterium matruchotii ATCC 33806 TaxID=566549 RepID=C0E2Q5_9CORY|nr:hypothetical protein CORMATOL_01260 [Corynebacterium matruchotii ATCC 33806]
MIFHGIFKNHYPWSAVCHLTRRWVLQLGYTCGGWLGNTRQTVKTYLSRYSGGPDGRHSIGMRSCLEYFG